MPLLEGGPGKTDCILVVFPIDPVGRECKRLCRGVFSPLGVAIRLPCCPGPQNQDLRLRLTGFCRAVTVLFLV